MKKTIIITSLMALMCGAVFAQPAGDQASVPVKSEAPAAVTKDIDSCVKDFLKASGLKRGYSDNGVYVATGYADIKGSSSDKNYEVFRNIAFNMAMADAKSSIAAFYGQEVSAELNSIFTKLKSEEARLEEAQAATQVDPTLLAKITKLANAKIDKELKKEGISMDSPKSKSVVEKVLASDEIKDVISRGAKFMVGGLVPIKVFEKDDEIMVVTYFSNTTRTLGGVINGKIKEAPKGAKRVGPSIDEWISNLDLDLMYLSNGFQLVTDEKGDYVVVSFGMATSENQNKRMIKDAKDNAETKALANIRRFAGELVAFNEISSTDLDSIILESGDSIDNVETQREQRINLIAAKLKMPGMSEIYQWKYTPKNTNREVYGSVCTWKLEDAQIANLLYDTDLFNPNGGVTSKPMQKDIKNKDSSKNDRKVDDNVRTGLTGEIQL